MIKTKRIKNRNQTKNKGRRRNYLKRQKGGFWSFGPKKTSSLLPNTNSINKQIEISQNRYQSVPREAPVTREAVRENERVGIEKLVGDRDKLHDRAENVYIASSATAVAAGIITGLASTGVGMPVAGLLAGALLIANKMLDLYKFNLLLRLLMQDAIFIIMDCYLLFCLIEKSYQIIENFADPVNDKCNSSGFSTQLLTSIGPMNNVIDKSNIAVVTSGNTNNNIKDKVRKYQINSIMQAQLRYQIEKLIKLLLSIMETKILDAIIHEPSLTGNAFGGLLRKEKEERTKSGRLSSKTFLRNYNRKFAGAYYITEINNILTIINSYIILLKSNLDSVLKKFEILDNSNYILIWKATLCTKEYNSYIKPNTQDVLAEAKNDARDVNVTQLIQSMDSITKVEEAGQQDMTANSSGGKRSRFIRKTEKRRRSVRR